MEICWSLVVFIIVAASPLPKNKVMSKATVQSQGFSAVLVACYTHFQTKVPWVHAERNQPIGIIVLILVDPHRTPPSIHEVPAPLSVKHIGVVASIVFFVGVVQVTGSHKPHIAIAFRPHQIVYLVHQHPQKVLLSFCKEAEIVEKDPFDDLIRQESAVQRVNFVLRTVDSLHLGSEKRQELGHFCPFAPLARFGLAGVPLQDTKVSKGGLQTGLSCRL